MDDILEVTTAIEEYLDQNHYLVKEVAQIKDVSPMLLGLQVTIDEEKLEVFLNGLAGIFSQHGLLSKKIIGQKIWDAFLKLGGSLEGLIEDNLAEGLWEKLARSIKIKTNILGYYFVQIRRKTLREVRVLVNSKNIGHHDQCSFCGALPILASINKDEDGMRYLHCSECLNVWQYERIKCPYCHTKNHDHFTEYHNEDNLDNVFIEVCENCGGKLKTVEKSKDKQINPVLEDTKSLYMDILLEKVKG